MTSAQDILDSVETLPLLSPSVMQLLEVVGNPDHTLLDLVEVVRHDALLTGEVLQCVNSARYGLINPVDSVTHAVNLLGGRTLVSLAIAVCAPKLYRTGPSEDDGISTRMWSHSLCAAIASREVARVDEDDIHGEDAFTAGLLHDIGKAVLLSYRPDLIRQVDEILDDEEGLEPFEAERRILGTDHGEVGAALARKWGLSDKLESAVAHHHHPDQAPEEYRDLVRVVQRGDDVAWMLDDPDAPQETELETRIKDELDRTLALLGLESAESDPVG